MFVIYRNTNISKKGKSVIFVIVYAFHTALTLRLALKQTQNKI